MLILFFGIYLIHFTIFPLITKIRGFKVKLGKIEFLIYFIFEKLVEEFLLDLLFNNKNITTFPIH